jgi:hypothetical protein
MSEVTRVLSAIEEGDPHAAGMAARALLQETTAPKTAQPVPAAV